MTIDFDSMQDVTAANLLKAVNVAIAGVLTAGQSYMINGRNFNRANLDELYEMRDKLSAEVAEAASPTGSMTAYVSFNKQQ
jgi:hypothetical protein